GIGLARVLNLAAGSGRERSEQGGALAEDALGPDGGGIELAERRRAGPGGGADAGRGRGQVAEVGCSRTGARPVALRLRVEPAERTGGTAEHGSDAGCGRGERPEVRLDVAVDLPLRRRARHEAAEARNRRSSH